MFEVYGVVRELELIHGEPGGVECLSVDENGEFPDACAVSLRQIHFSCNRTEVVGAEEYAFDIVVHRISQYSLHLQASRSGIHLSVAIVLIYYGLEFESFAWAVGTAVGQQKGLPTVLEIIVRIGVRVHAESVAASHQSVPETATCHNLPCTSLHSLSQFPFEKRRPVEMHTLLNQRLVLAVEYFDFGLFHRPAGHSLGNVHQPSVSGLVHSHGEGMPFEAELFPALAAFEYGCVLSVGKGGETGFERVGDIVGAGGVFEFPGEYSRALVAIAFVDGHFYSIQIAKAYFDLVASDFGKDGIVVHLGD